VVAVHDRLGQLMPLGPRKCEWCSEDYLGFDNFHVCSDGTKYSDRVERIKDANLNPLGYWGQARDQIAKRKANEISRLQRIQDSQNNLQNYARLDLTEEDKKWLRGMKISWE